jgi:hypothetical protein
MDHTITSDVPKCMKVTFVKCRPICEGADFVGIVGGKMNIFQER